MKTLITKNRAFKAEIFDVTNEGLGVCKIDDVICFVPFTAVGDVVDGIVVSVRKNFCYGKALNIETPGIGRENPDCPYFGRCGSCVFAHLKYSEELKIKENYVKRVVSHKLKSSLEFLPITKAPATTAYRNKGIFPFSTENGKVVWGFYGRRSHRVIPCENCILHPSSFSDIANFTADFLTQTGITTYDETSGKGIFRHLFLREMQGSIAVCIVATKKDERFLKYKDLLCERFSSVVSVHININNRRDNVLLSEKIEKLTGDDYLTAKLCDREFNISPLSFFQVNTAATELLYNRVSEFLEDVTGELLVDLFCGTGTIGLCLSDKFSRIIGVEINKSAVQNAKQNAKLNGIENAEFIAEDAAVVAKKLHAQNIIPDAITLDPPRSGLTPELIALAASFKAKNIVYISCNPNTLARDLIIFEQHGYFAKKAAPHDLFPRTSHCECVVLLCFCGDNDEIK